jgi:hypothetical protein
VNFGEIDVAHIIGAVIILDLPAGPIEAFDPELVAGLHHLDHRNVRMPSIVRLDLRDFGWPGQIDFEGCPWHGRLPQVECFIEDNRAP